MPLKPRLPFDVRPIEACDKAVQAALNIPGIPWDAQRFAGRSRLENALRHFLAAPEILFVLVGLSGTGKSWAVAEWTAHTLHGSVRLLIPGSDLDHEDQRSLSRLAA